MLLLDFMRLYGRALNNIEVRCSAVCCDACLPDAFVAAHGCLGCMAAWIGCCAGTHPTANPAHLSCCSASLALKSALLCPSILPRRWVSAAAREAPTLTSATRDSSRQAAGSTRRLGMGSSFLGCCAGACCGCLTHKALRPWRLSALSCCLPACCIYFCHPPCSCLNTRPALPHTLLNLYTSTHPPTPPPAG